jgi:nitrate/nitrite-specific signal transduction histidine kinase
MTRRRQSSPDRHVGLKSMRERARVIQGQLEIRSRRGRGTRVTLRVALNPGSV